MIRYYAGQEVVVPDGALEHEHAYRDCDFNNPQARCLICGQTAAGPRTSRLTESMVEGCEFRAGRCECDVKMDALKEGRRCKRGTEGCCAKHTLWRMWGPQLKGEPWGGT